MPQPPPMTDRRTGFDALIVTERRPAIPGGAPQTIAEILDRHVTATPDADALVGASGRLTYRELDELVERTADALGALGVELGDRVGACLPNDVDIVVLFLAVMRLGSIWVGIPKISATAELAYLANDADLSLLFADPVTVRDIESSDIEFPTTMRAVEIGHDEQSVWRRFVRDSPARTPFPSVDPFAPAAISYTSGTTGRQKGVVHSQHNLLMPGAVTVASGEFPPEGPLGTSAPFTILNVMVLIPITAFQAGATCVMIDGNRPANVASWIERERIMHMVAVPTVYHDLIGDPSIRREQLATLRRPRSGGAAVTEDLRRRWAERFDHPLTSSLALTEGPTFVSREDASTPRVENSLGRAVDHVDITIRDLHDRPVPTGEAGEICVGPATTGRWAGVYTPMLGYWGRPDETRAALRGGVLHTGDIGRLDADGNLSLVDRKSSLIIRGGSNIYPAEVERVVALDPCVAECALVPRPDERLGERTVLFLRPESGCEIDIDDIMAHCTAHLAKYKVPDEAHVVDALPRTPLGKVNRSALGEIARGDTR